MATKEQTETGARTVIASWVSTSFADEVKAYAERERRSVSSVIRIAPFPV